MNKSDSIKELSTALAKAQGKIKGAVKTEANTFFKSKYADLASVVEAIRGPLSENGLSYVQLTIPSEKDEVQIETVLMHESGEWISSTIALPVAKADAQGFGSAMTYARRYGLSAMVGVAPEDDDGNAAAKAAPKTVAGQTWDQMEPDEQNFLQGIADSVTGEYLDKGAYAEAVAYIDSKKLTADEKVALWSRFDSKHRAAMKAATKKVA